MVAAGEDSAEAEDDDQEECCAKREAQGRPRCIHVGWRKILALHHLNLRLLLLTKTTVVMVLFLHSCGREGGLKGARVGFGLRKWDSGNLKEMGFGFWGVWKWEFIKMSKEEGGGERESTCKGYTQMSRPWYGMRVGSTCLVLSIMN